MRQSLEDLILKVDKEFHISVYHGEGNRLSADGDVQKGDWRYAKFNSVALESGKNHAKVKFYP
jgi:hypothetical protein